MIHKVSIVLPPAFDGKHLFLLVQVLSKNYDSYTMYFDSTKLDFYFYYEGIYCENFNLIQFERSIKVLPNSELLIQGTEHNILLKEYVPEIGQRPDLRFIQSKDIEIIKYQGYHFQNTKSSYRIFLQAKKLEYSTHTIQLLRAIMKLNATIIIHSEQLGEKWNLSIALENKSKKVLFDNLQTIFEILRLEPAIHIQISLNSKKQLQNENLKLELGETGYSIELNQLKKLIYQIPSILK